MQNPEEKAKPPETEQKTDDHLHDSETVAISQEKLRRKKSGIED